YRRNLERWLHDEKVEDAAIVEFGTLETILGSIKSGLEISLVPESTVKDALEREELFGYELSPEYSEISTDFIWHKDTYMTTAMNKFIQTVQEYRDAQVFLHFFHPAENKKELLFQELSNRKQVI